MEDKYFNLSECSIELVQDCNMRPIIKFYVIALKDGMENIIPSRCVLSSSIKEVIINGRSYKTSKLIDMMKLYLGLPKKCIIKKFVIECTVVQEDVDIKIIYPRRIYI